MLYKEGVVKGECCNSVTLLHALKQNRGGEEKVVGKALRQRMLVTRHFGVEKAMPLDPARFRCPTLHQIYARPVTLRWKKIVSDWALISGGIQRASSARFVESSQLRQL